MNSQVGGINYFVKNDKKKDLLIISVVYVIAHFMLLIASGLWWDDWWFSYQDESVIKELAWQLGRPSLYYIIKCANKVPHFIYRWIVFFIYYYCGILFYKIIELWLRIEDEDALWITLVYITLPINDCRIVLATFPYAIGLLFLMASLSRLLSSWRESSLSLWNRGVIAVFLVLSFILNSNLFFCVIIPIIIFTIEKNIIKVLKIMDIYLLPFIYFFIKKAIFPEYGAFASYNVVDLQNIVNTFELLPKNIFFISRKIILNYLLSLRFDEIVCGVLLFIPIFVVVMILQSCYWKKKNKADSNDGYLMTKIMVIGVIFAFIAMFPYVLIRQRIDLNPMGARGRDTMLIGFGASLAIYGFFKLVIKSKAREMLLMMMIAMGCVFFITYYVSYQRDYYRQLGFRYQLEQNKELDNCDTIVFLAEDEDLIYFTSCQQLNGNAEMVYGNQNKYILDSVSSSQQRINEIDETDEMVLVINHMSEYKKADISAVVYYSFDVGFIDTLKMKIYEFVSTSRYEQYIMNRSEAKVYYKGSSEFEEILKK